MFKSEFRWILFAALYAVFTILVSANEAEEKIVDNYYYENEDDLMRTESFDENFDTNSTEEEDDYDYEDYYSLDLESDLEKLEEGSQEELSGPRSYECGSGPSKILDLLDKGVIDPLQLAMDDLLDYANETEILDCIHIMENMTVFKELISVLPDKVLGAIASRPGLFEKLSDDAIVAFAEDENAVAAVDVDTLLEVANGRPHTIERLPVRTLDMFAKMPMFIDGLTTDTKSKLIHSKKMAEKLSLLSKSSLLSVVVNNCDFLTTLPKNTDYPARPLIAKMMMDTEFLRQIPVKVHAKLAESNFRYQLSTDSILLILSVHPELPSKLSDVGMRVNRHYITNRTFVDKVPCAVFLNMAYDKKFMNKLDEKEMLVLSGSDTLWKCLPVELVRKLMRQYDGDQLGFKNMVFAANSMTKDKSLDAAVVANIIRYQVPTMMKNWWTRKRAG